MKVSGRIAAFGFAVACALCLPLFSFAATNAGVEAQVREYFADAPVMAAIASCESRFRQFNTAGTALHGGLGNGMVGIFQIHARVHTATAKKLGIDVRTVEGNMTYARYLYEKEGTRPWVSSKHCWSKISLAAAEDQEAEVVRLQKRVVELTTQLMQLQNRFASAE